jgi:hypothetical protein
MLLARPSAWLLPEGSSSEAMESVSLGDMMLSWLRLAWWVGLGL